MIPIYPTTTLIPAVAGASFDGLGREAAHQMQFIDRHPLYRIIRTTGPTHNLLGLQISSEPVMGEPGLEALDGNTGGLDGQEVAAQVMLDIAQAGAELQVTFHIQ